MKNNFKRLFQRILLPFIAISVSACSSEKPKSINLYDPDAVESEVYEYEHFYFEKFEDEVLFYDNLEEQMVGAEKTIDDLVEHEFFVSEEVLTEDFSESFYATLPEGFENYDIDWEGVLTRFDIGAAVIVFTGIATIATLNTPVAYIFATAFTEGVKQALIGGTIGGIINVAVKSIQAGEFNSQAAKKYFVEGLADGFMWGAISGTVTGLVKGAKVVSDPNNYFSADGTQLLGKTDASGNFYDSKGKLLGKAKIGTNGNTYVVDSHGKVTYMFGENGLSTHIVESYPSNLSTIRAPQGRYSGGDFTVQGNKVYKGGKLVGELNEVGDVIGVNEYRGMLLCSIDANGKSTANYMRAINSGLKLDCYGNITNTFVPSTDPPTLIGGAQTFGSYVLNDGKNISVVFDGTNYYLMDASNKIAGMLDDALNIQTGWNKVVANLANQGVKTNKEMIIRMIQNDIPYDYGPSFTDDVIVYVQQYGKFPDGFQGHHINNVANFPWIANNPDNIQFYSFAGHLAAHGGKWSRPTSGELKNLTEVFTSIFGGL